MATKNTISGALGKLTNVKPKTQTKAASGKNLLQDTLKAAGLNPLIYNAPTDMQLEEQAKNKTSADYLSKLNEARGLTTSQQLLLRQSLEKIDPSYNERLQKLTDAYADSRRTLSDQANTRGMGRSTYALDMQQRNLDEQTAAQNELAAEKQREVNEINGQIDYLQSQLLQKEQTLSANMRSDIADIISSLSKERDDKQREAAMYNNDLLYKLLSSQQDQRNKDRQYQLETDKFQFQKDSAASKSTGGGGGGRSGGKGKGGANSATAKVSASDTSVLKTWDALTDNGKLLYYNTNAEKLQKNHPDAAAKMRNEVLKIKMKPGVTPTINKNYNLYKDQPKLRVYSGGR